jgi:hypothetical protein
MRHCSRSRLMLFTLPKEKCVRMSSGKLFGWINRALLLRKLIFVESVIKFYVSNDSRMMYGFGLLTQINIRFYRPLPKLVFNTFLGAVVCVTMRLAKVFTIIAFKSVQKITHIHHSEARAKSMATGERKNSTGSEFKCFLPSQFCEKADLRRFFNSERRLNSSSWFSNRITKCSSIYSDAKSLRIHEYQP